MGAISVPNSAAIRQARHVLNNQDWGLGGQATVMFHPAYCHIQPWVLAALGAWALAHRRADGTISVENPHRAMYAWRFGLADYLGIDPPASVSEHEEAGRFVPLRTIKTADDLTRLLSDIVTLLHVDKESSKAVMYAMSEMVRNTLEHSRTRDGAVVCAQSYAGNRGRHYVSIGVADTGIGIRLSLGSNHPTVTDRAALIEAIKPGVSGAQQGPFGSSDNAGAGLFITRRLSQATDGYFAVGSGNALFRTSKAVVRPSDDQLVIDISPFKGTLVCVEIGLDHEGDFAATFAEARAAFSSQLTAARTQVSRRVRFA